MVCSTFEEHYVALLILCFSIPRFSSLSVYGILLGGWASNSRYAFLGALRSASQMISYELVLSLLILLVCILAQSFNFIDIVYAQTTVWFLLPLLPFVLVYFIAILAKRIVPLLIYLRQKQNLWLVIVSNILGVHFLFTLLQNTVT